MEYSPSQKSQELIAEAERLEAEAKKLRAQEQETEERWWAANAASFNIEQPEVFMHLLTVAVGRQGRAAKGALALEMYRLYGEAFTMPKLTTTGPDFDAVTHPHLTISDKGWSLPTAELASKVEAFFKNLPEDLKYRNILPVGQTTLSDLHLKPNPDGEWMVVWGGRVLRAGGLEDLLAVIPDL